MVPKAIDEFLEASGVAYEIVPCDPAFADTADFCARYGYAQEHSANAILVKAKTGSERFVLCLVLATTRLDVNHTVRKRIGARRVSFANVEETRRLTGMEPGGVSPFALPESVPVWVDDRIAALERVILGGGDRTSKIIVEPRIFERTPHTEIVTGLAVERD